MADIRRLVEAGMVPVLAKEFANVLDAASVGPVVDAAINPAIASSSRTRLTEVSLRDLGCVPGQDISNALNTAIASADPGTSFIIPGISGVGSDKWLVGAPIDIGRSNISLRGVGSQGNSGSVLTRTGAFPLLRLQGTSGGTSSAGMVGENLFSGVGFHGNGLNANVFEARFAYGFFLDHCAILAPGTGAAFFSDQQIQDYFVAFCRMEGGGTADGLIGTFHVDDSNGTNAGHSQNHGLYFTTLESYNGTAVKFVGKGAGPGNSLLEIIGVKVESPNRSNVPDIDLDQCAAMRVSLRQAVSKGVAGNTKSSIIKVTNSIGVAVDALVLHQAAGATLTQLVDRSGSVNCPINLRVRDTATVDGLTAGALILDTSADRNAATADNFGTAPNQKRLTSITQQPVERGVQREIRTIDAVYQRVIRTDAAGVIQSSVRVQEITNATNTRYFGFDGNNNVAGGDVLNIGGAPRWVLDNSPTGLSTFVNGLRFGTLTTGPALLSGAGSPEGVVSAPVGSLYSNTTASAAAGSRFFYKGSGTGNTGWIGY